FVRLQCAAFGLHYNDPVYLDLRRRGEELLGRHREAWRLPRGAEHKWWDCHRGLPVAHFEPRDPAPDDLVGTEAFAWVEGLRAWRINRADDVHALLESPWLRTVTRLDLSRTRMGTTVALLAASPQLARMRWLDLSDGEIGPTGAAALA